MTKEQEEAIKYLEKQINYFKEQIKFIEAVDCDYYDEEYKLYKNRVKQFETVLNMLKEKDAEIEKKDKIIDLMAEFIYAMWCDYPGSITKKLKDNEFDDKECGTCESKEKNCLDCIKQYFERKAENGR